MINKRKKSKIEIDDRNQFINKALYWAEQFTHYAYFNSNNYHFPHNPFKDFIAINAIKKVPFSNGENFKNLQEFIDNNQDYLIGHFTYDLKNEIEKLSSTNEQKTHFEPMSFFIPETVIWLKEEIIIESFKDPESILEDINKTLIPKDEIDSKKFISDTSKEDYVKTVKALKDHIVEGDIYEINYCHQFNADEIKIDPINTYLKLNHRSPAPFSALYKNKNNYLISASPERFIKKEKNNIISQPIKGTAPRSKNQRLDDKLKNDLQSNEKERAENMMIVDLVRNDLAKSCTSGSIKVEEMFGIYSFPLWHQMISTVTGQLKYDTQLIECIKNAFPMGSMTGAPKIKVMELIERYEVFKRNIYSGSIGYFLPNGDFDFNVIIRSLAYNAKEKKASFAVGGAITYDSDPEKEYEECLLKAQTFTTLFELIN